MSDPESLAEVLDRAIERDGTSPFDERQVQHMVRRFLAWKLPEGFSPDGGISFERFRGGGNGHPFKNEPVGTNVFDATQATAMICHMLEGLPAPAGRTRRDGGHAAAGLPVAGYRPQSDDAITLVNGNKEIEERMLRSLDQLAGLETVDKRWLAIGRTQIEQGFMAVNRAIFRPERVQLKAMPAVETGWVIEREDSSPAEPLYYFPYPDGEQWTKLHVNALRLARKEDAQRVATVLGIAVRICEHQWG